MDNDLVYNNVKTEKTSKEPAKRKKLNNGGMNQYTSRSSDMYID